MTKAEFYEELEAMGFELIKAVKYDSFGDFSDTFRNNRIGLRYGTDKSIPIIEICKWGLWRHEWLYLGYITQYLLKSQNYSIPPIGEMEKEAQKDMDFFVENFDRVVCLFSIMKYPITKMNYLKIRKRYAKLEKTLNMTP